MNWQICGRPRRHRNKKIFGQGGVGRCSNILWAPNDFGGAGQSDDYEVISGSQSNSYNSECRAHLARPNLPPPSTFVSFCLPSDKS